MRLVGTNPGGGSASAGGAEPLGTGHVKLATPRRQQIRNRIGLR